MGGVLNLRHIMDYYRKNISLERLIPALFLIILFGYHLFDLSPMNVWAQKWILLFLLLIPFCFKHFPWTAIPLVCITLYQGIYEVLGPSLYENISAQQTMRFESAMTLITFMTMAYMFMALRKSAYTSYFVRYLCWSAVGLSIWITLTPRADYQVPVFNNPSMAGSYIAMLLPFMSGWGVAISLIAIYKVHATVPVIAACVALYAKYAHKLPALKVSLFALTLAIVTHFLNPEYFSEILAGRGRYEEWHDMMRWWSEHHLQLRGAGLGTQRVLSFITQNHDDPLWFWMHNDYLQILFEQGYGALCATILALFGAIYITRNRPILLASLLSCMVVMSANFPIHMPIHGFFMICLAALIYRKA